MASVGSVEIDLLLNTESLKRQFSELKDLAVLPTLKIDKIEFDKNEIEKGFKDICVPFKFCEGSYERAISNIRDKFENEKICLNIETEIKIDLTESIKTLEALSKETAKPTTKKILVVSDTKKAEATIRQVSTKPISIESSTANKEPTPISVKLSEESLLAIQTQLDSQEFKITVASDISSALVKTATPAITVPQVANPSVNAPVVAATTVTVPDKALQASANTEQSQAKIEKSSEKSTNLLFKVVSFIGLLLSAAEVIVSVINGVRNSILKLEPGIIRELRNAPANAIRGVSEGAGFTAGKYGIGKVASGVRDKLEASGVDIGGIKKKVDTFITKIFTDLTDYIKKYNQKALPPQETAKYFLPPATSPPLLEASKNEVFPGIGASDKPPDNEYEEIRPRKKPEKLKELALELELDDASVDSEVKSVIQSFKDSISQISLEDITIDSIKTQAVSIVETLKESLSNVTVDSVKEQVKATVDNLRDVASDVTVESVKGRVKEAVETLKEKASDLTIEGVKETVKTKASEVKSKIPEKVAKASDKLPESVKAQALGVVETLKENLSNITVDSVKLQVKATIDSLKENLSNLTVESVKAEFTNIVETFKEKLSNVTVESVKAQVDVVLEKVKTTFNEILEKLPKTKEEAKEKLKAGGVKLRDKATATATQAKEKTQQLAGKIQVKAGEIKGVVDSLSDKGVEDYKKIFEDLSKQLGVKLGSIELPKIEAASDLAGQVVAAYNELTNTIVLPQNIIDLLNNGVGKSIAEKGEAFVSDALSFLTHEITHAFQVVKDIPDNISNIEIPDIGQRLMTEIEKLAEKSTGEYLQELQKLNPGKSLEFLKAKYAKTIEEVKKREKEAYIVQLKLTDGIVASFRRFIPEDGKVQKGVDNVIAKAKTVAGNVSGNISGKIPESVRSAATGAASKSTQLLSETVSVISEKTEGVRAGIQANIDGLLFDAKFIADDITAQIPEPIKSSGEAIGNSISAIKEGLDNVAQATDNAKFTIQTNVDNLLFEAKLATGTLTSKLPKPIKKQKTPSTLAAVQFNPSEIKQKVLENTESVLQTISEAQQKLENEAKLQEFDGRLGEKIVKPKKTSKTREAVQEVFNPVTFESEAKELADAAKEIKLPTKKNRDNNKQALSKIKQSLARLARIPLENINKRRDRIMAAMSVEIELRAEEIKKQLPDNIEQSSVIFATGGFAGKGGAGTADLAKQIEEEFRDSLVVPVANKTFDTITKVVDGLPKWLGEIIKDKILKQNIVDGVIPDAKELAAQAKAYAEKYNVPVRAIGHSGGGFVVQQAVKQAQAMDVDLKGVGIGTPDIGLLNPEDDPNYQAYLAKDDPLRKAAKPLLGRGKTKETSGIGISAADPVKGHSVENYLKDMKLLNEINKHFNLTTQKTASGLGIVTGFFKKVGNAIRETIQPFEVIGRRIAAADKRVTNHANNFVKSIEKIKESSPLLRPFIEAIQALSPALLALTIFKTVTGWMTGLVKSSFEVTAKFQAMDTITRFLAGSSEKYAASVKFLSGEIGRLSIDIESATRGYNKLAATTRGTVLEGKTNEIFTGVAQAGAAFNLTASEVEGSILALSQIAGKGVVSMEELRGQLAERIPGAFQIAARSMNMTEQQLNALIATGSLTAVDFLPKFARQLSIETAGSIESSSQTANAAMTRFQNSFKVLQVSVGKPLQPIIVPGLDVAAKGLEILSKGAGIVAEAIAILTVVSFVNLNKSLLFTIKSIFAKTIAIKSLGGALISLNNVIQRTITPTLKALGLQTIVIFGVIEVFKVLKFTFDTFFSETTADKIEKTLSERFDKAAEKAEELRKKLAKLRGEIDEGGVEKNKNGKTNLGNVIQKNADEKNKEGIVDTLMGQKEASRQLEQIKAWSKDIVEQRASKAYIESANAGEFKVLSDEVNTIISSSDEIIAKSKEKSDAISKLTAQATFAKGDELKDIRSQIEVLQTELQGDLATNGDGSYGLNSIDDTAQSVSFALEKLKADLEDTVQEGPKKIIQDQITVLEDYQKKLGEITSQAGESQPLTMFISKVSKIGTAFQESSRLAEISLSKTKAAITENLRGNLTKDYTAENNAALAQSGAEVSGTIQKLKDTQTVIDSLTGTLKSSTGGVSGYFDEFKDFSLEKLQSELQKTDDKDEARKRTLEALIKLRESEGSKVELQTTLQEQLLQQERERFRVAQENLDRQLAISRATVDINDARNQSVSVRKQIQGGSSQADIGLIDAENQVNVAKQREALREQELAGIKKLQADKLISAKDYENKVRELTIQGAQNSLAILQASLQQEQALRAKEVENIQRQLEQAKADSEAKQTDIGFNVERKGFDIQQNNLKEQISTGKSDELNKQLEYQKQLAEKSGDISKQEKISAEIYKNQLASLAVKQDLQTKSLELTQAQQRLEMQRSEMQAQVALLEAESQVNQLQANKATAEEIAIAQQTVDIRQKQVNFISEQKANLSEVQKLEKQNLSVQNETQKKDLERSRNLQVIEEDEKRISKEIEIAKSNNELRNKEIERSSQLLNSQLELYKVQSDYKKSELDFQTELANKVNNVSALETIKAISYADQVASLKVQNLAQTESLKLTQEQQRIQAEIDVLDAQATLRKLELNKGSAQDIELAKQQLDAAQQQLGNLEAIQSNERERVGIEQQSALKNLERQQYLEMQDLAVKKITASLEQQSKLFNAQQNVLQSVNELDKQRLDYQLELANRSGDINRVEQLKAEIYLQQREEILRQGDAQLKSLDITQKQNNIELERQKLMAQSLLLEAKANLEKGKLKGASAQELNDLQQYVTIQEQQLSGIQQLVSANQEVQSLEKQQLEIQQQTKLEQIDQQRQLELIDLQVQKITKSYESQQQQLDLNNSELERQSALVNAKSGLNDSVSNLEKQRLDFRMQLAEIAENEVQKQQIKQQLYEQELKSLAQRQAIERETLKIAQLKQNIDIKRQEIQAEIATLEAQANIEQAKARGAGESELAALYKVLALRMQQEKSVQADKVNLAQIQQLERQKLNVDQTAANENLQQQRILDQARTAKEQQQKNSKGGNIVDTGVNVPLNINIPPLKPLPIEEVKISKTDSDKKNEIIESMKVTATNVYINGTVSASSGQNVNIETQNSDLEKVKKIENEINKLAKESRLKAANAAMDDYINKWNSDAEKERIVSGLTAEQATAGGYEQAKLAREEAERIKADLASGKLKTTGAEGFKPQAIMTPLQRLQAELDAAQKAVDNSKNKPNKNTSNSQETEGGTNVNVENLVIVSSDPTGDARQVLNDLAASKGKC